MVLKPKEVKEVKFKVAPHFVEGYAYIRNDKEVKVKDYIALREEYYVLHTIDCVSYFNKVNKEGKQCNSGSLFPYVGAKASFYKLVQTLLRERIDFSDEKVETIVTVFGGALNDPLNIFPYLLKNNLNPKIVINDINESLTHFYTMIRDCKDELIEEIQFILDHKKEMFGQVPTIDQHMEYQDLMKMELNNLELGKVFNVTRAALFHLVMLASFSGNYEWKKGKSHVGKTSELSKYKQLDTAVERVEMVSFYFNKFEIIIHCKDYMELFSMYNTETTLWLLDSPYVKLDGDELIPTKVTYGSKFDHRKYNTEVLKLKGQMIYHNYRNKALTSLFETKDGLRHIEHKKAIKNGKAAKGTKQPRCVEVIYYTTWKSKKTSKRKSKPSVQSKMVVKPMVQSPVVPSTILVVPSVPMVAVASSMIINNNIHFKPTVKSKIIFSAQVKG